MVLLGQSVIFDNYFILCDKKMMDVILDSMRYCSYNICAEAQV